MLSQGQAGFPSNLQYNYFTSWQQMFEPLEEERDKEDPLEIFGWLRDEPIIDLSHMELANNVNGYVGPDQGLLSPGGTSNSDAQHPGASTGKNKMPLPCSDSNSGFGYGSQLNTPTVMGQHNTNKDNNSRNNNSSINIGHLWEKAIEMERELSLNNARDASIGTNITSTTMKKIKPDKSIYQPTIYPCRPNIDTSCVSMENNLYNYNWNWNWNDKSTFNPCVSNTQLAPARDNPLFMEVKTEDQNNVTDVKGSKNPSFGFANLAEHVKTVRKRRNTTRPRRFSGASSSTGLFERLVHGRETTETTSPFVIAQNSLESASVPMNGYSTAGSPLKLQGGIDTSGTDNLHLKEKEFKFKNLKFLLQKELKASDVGALGRTVLPKKESEANLPTLTAREGIQMYMEDMHLPRMWNFKYRYWPNNKSRMYVMESTGEFVRTHSLQVGDFVMFYKDEINDNYIIRARKAESQLTSGTSIEKSGLYGSSNLLDDGSIHQSGSEKDNEVSSKSPYATANSLSLGDTKMALIEDIFSNELNIHFSNDDVESPELESIPGFGSDEFPSLEFF